MNWRLVQATSAALLLPLLGLGCGPGPAPSDPPDPLDPRLTDDDLCNDCHSSADDLAESGFLVDGVRETGGAHETHANPTVREPLTCDFCHVVPTSPEEPDGSDPANVHLNGVADVFVEGNDWVDQYELSRDCATECHEGFCASACHSLAANEPDLPWMTVEPEDFDLGCTGCHRETFPAHDTEDPLECSLCHDQTMDEEGNFKELGLHVNAVVDVVEDTCALCHGQPPDEHVTGVTDPTVVGLIEDCANCHPVPLSPFPTYQLHRDEAPDFVVSALLCDSCHEEVPSTGAHDAHANTTVGPPVACSSCHEVVPTAEGNLLEHLRSPLVSFGPLATTNPDGPPLEATYDPALQGCSNVYCHGGGLAEGQLVDPLLWTATDVAECGDCHGLPPDSPVHAGSDPNCFTCHPSTIPNEHVDGVINTL